MQNSIDTARDASMIGARPQPPSGPEHFPVNRRFQGIPSFTVSNGGRLYATWYTGGPTECVENYVTLAVSDDGGESWIEPVQVIDHPDPRVRSFDPCLWTAPDGAVWWFWTQSYCQTDFNIGDGRCGVWMVRCAEPDAGLPRWTPPVRIANGSLWNKPVVLENGEWAFPTALWNDLGGPTKPVIPELRHEKFSNITISPDCGKTFFRRGGADIPDRCFDEHHLLELKDGRLWMTVRTNYGAGQSFSSDGGATWTPGEPASFGGPNSRFFIRRLRSGRILLVTHIDREASNWREKPGRPRNNLIARLSEDEGRSWIGGLLLDERDGVSYPDGFEDREGNLHIIYDHGRTEAGEILRARFREEDILAGRPVSAAALFKRRISSFFPVESAK